MEQQTNSKSSGGHIAFEQKIPKKIEKYPHTYGIGVRHTLAVITFFGLSIIYSFRVNLSVAIVAMVNRTENSLSENASLSDACPESDSYQISGDSGYNKKGEFDWDESTQGFILGAYFYGYIITSVLGGVASQKWGGRIVMGVGVLLSAVLTILSPISARSSTMLFVVCRALIGCTSGVILPAVHNLIPKWYPTMERSKFTTIIFSGLHFGTVITMPISGWLSASDFLGGWPSVFYVLGCIGLLWVVCWFIVVSDEPSSHPRISDDELSYIVNGCPVIEDNQPVPWTSIFKSIPFWAIAIVHFGHNWGFYTFLTELPTYLDNILHIDIKNSGSISAMPYLATWFISVSYSFIVDFLLKKNILSILSIRRLSLILGGYGAMICLIVLLFAKCNVTMALTILILSGAFDGFVYAGFYCSHADISPRYAGTLMGLTNVPGTISGFAAPTVTGALTNNNQTLKAWRMVFLISAIIYGATTTVYITFIKAEVQNWDNPREGRQKKEAKRNEKIENIRMQSSRTSITETNHLP